MFRLAAVVLQLLLELRIGSDDAFDILELDGVGIGRKEEIIIDLIQAVHRMHVFDDVANTVLDATMNQRDVLPFVEDLPETSVNGYKTLAVDDEIADFFLVGKNSQPSDRRENSHPVAIDVEPEPDLPIEQPVVADISQSEFFAVPIGMVVPELQWESWFDAALV